MSDIGDTLNRAERISLTSDFKRHSNRIGGSDKNDIYRFRLPFQSRFRARLEGLSSNADMELIRDRNGNGSINPGEVVASSRATGRRQDSISILGLEPGTYYLRVFSKGSSTSYRLELAASRTNKISPQYEVVQRTNRYRLQNGKLPLALNTQLSKAAQRYSQHMAEEDVFSHQGRDGSSPWERIRAADYNYSDAAENLAAGHTTASSAMRGWINSPGHRANLLAYQVQEIGVGYFYLRNDGGRYTYQHYWAQSFGTPADRSTPSAPSNPGPYPDRDD